jgi:hypothetical protein
MQKIFQTHNYKGNACIFELFIKKSNINNKESKNGCIMQLYNPFNADQVKKYKFAIIKNSMSHWRVALSYFNTAGIVIPNLKIYNDYIIINNNIIHNGDKLLFDGKGGLFKITNIDLIPNLEEKIYQDIQTIKKYQEAIKKQKIKIGVITTKKELVKKSLVYGTQFNALYRVEDIFYGKPQENLRSYLLNKNLESLSKIKENLFKNLVSYFTDIPLKFQTFIRLIDIPLKDWTLENRKKLKALYEKEIFNSRGEPISGGPLMMCQKELYQTQVDAIIEAMVQSKNNLKISIGLPNTTKVEQIELLKKMVDSSKSRYKKNLNISLYTHDETLSLDINNIKRISPLLSAVSIGASDLTADVTGISRNNLLEVKKYKEKNGINYDIYKRLIPDVKKIIKERVEIWKNSNPNIKLVCCSSHIEESLKFFYDMKFDFIGSSPSKIFWFLEKLYKLTNETKKETRFFGISRKKLDEFYSIQKKYGLDIYGILEQNAPKIPPFQQKEIYKKIKNIKSCFVFAGLPTSGKSTLVNILHHLTGKKITSFDLIKEIRKGELCEKFNVTKSEFKENFEKLMKKRFAGSYREWITEIFKEAVRESINNNTLLDIGGYNLLREKEYLFLKENKFKIIYIDIGKKLWLTNSSILALKRPDFKEAYEKDKTNEKKEYQKFCEKTYDYNIDICKSRSNITIRREQLEPLELLIASIAKLNSRQIHY